MIRADASVAMGTGHVMRCLALAQAWQDKGGRAAFAMVKEAPALRARLNSEEIEVYHYPSQPGGLEDARQTVATAGRLQARWVVVDGYHFGTEYQRIVRDGAPRLLVIDDCGYAGHYYSDIILNQDLCANEALYRNRQSYTRLLLGPQYAFLRREFARWRKWRREIPKIGNKVLVTMGGGDSNNVTLKVIEALQRVDVDSLEAVVVVGSSNPNYHELQAAVLTSHVSIRLDRNATNMPELMAWADVAVSAGGGTCWELCLMGTPSLILAIAENQSENVQCLDQFGAVISLGQYQDVDGEQIASALEYLCEDKNRRFALSRLGRSLIDGMGATRVAHLMMSADHS